MSAASGVADDKEGGLFDRLRSLPIRLLSIVSGRVGADTALVAWGVVVMTAAGFAVGFRVSGTTPGAVAALGLTILYGFAFVWLFIALGLVAGSPQAAQGLSFLVFPLSFVSSAYVPVSTMPGWMQAFANNQPMTQMVNTVRLLTGGSGAGAARTLRVVLPVALAAVDGRAGRGVRAARRVEAEDDVRTRPALTPPQRKGQRRSKSSSSGGSPVCRTELMARRRRSWASIIQSMKKAYSSTWVMSPSL